MTSVAGEERERAIRWSEEGRNVLGILLGVLNDYDRLKGAAETAEKERDRLQGMVYELQRSRNQADSLQRECEQLHQEVSRLQAENERYQRERNEIAESITKFMNDALSRLRSEHQHP